MAVRDAKLKKELRRFLIEANLHGYATNKTSNWTTEKDHSTTIAYNKGDWKYHDNFFGGEPYGGREVVFYRGKPIWMMIYYGAITEMKLDVKGLYRVLQKALRADPESNPFRGPKTFKDGQFSYNNNWKGGVESFSGKEFISYKGKRVYWASYLGGFVDKRIG